MASRHVNRNVYALMASLVAAFAEARATQLTVNGARRVSPRALSWSSRLG